MTAAPFIIGIAVSTFVSFSMIERCSERRCIELRRDLRDDAIIKIKYPDVSSFYYFNISFCL